MLDIWVGSHVSLRTMVIALIRINCIIFLSELYRKMKLSISYHSWLPMRFFHSKFKSWCRMTMKRGKRNGWGRDRTVEACNNWSSFWFWQLDITIGLFAGSRKWKRSFPWFPAIAFLHFYWIGIQYHTPIHPYIYLALQEKVSNTVLTFDFIHAFCLRWEIPNCGDPGSIPILKANEYPNIYSGICALYERKLKELNPAVRNLSYDISDLYNFIDGLADLSALVYLSLSHAIYLYFPVPRISLYICMLLTCKYYCLASTCSYDHSIQAYLPYDRQWIKQRTFQHLKKLAHWLCMNYEVPQTSNWWQSWM